MRHSRDILRYAVIIITVMVVIFPVWWIFATSLETLRTAFTFPGGLLPRGDWANYTRAWALAPWLHFFGNSLFISTTSTGLAILTGVLSAYSFVFLPWKGKRWVFAGVLGTIMVPFEAIIVPEYLVVRDLGWVNSYQAMIIPFAASGFAVFFLRQFMRALPIELRDAATLDGASHWQYLWRVVVPNIRAALATIAVYLFLLSWNAFLWPLVVTSGSTYEPVQVGLANFLETANGTDWTTVAAAAAFVTLPVLIFYFFAQRQIVEAISRSGLKG